MRRSYLIVVPRPLPRSAPQVLDRVVQTNARGAAQVLDRGAQAVARGNARCASQVLDRGAQAKARGAEQARYLISVPRPMRAAPSFCVAGT